MFGGVRAVQTDDGSRVQPMAFYRGADGNADNSDVVAMDRAHVLLRI